MYTLAPSEKRATAGSRYAVRSPPIPDIAVDGLGRATHTEDTGVRGHEERENPRPCPGAGARRAISEAAERGAGTPCMAVRWSFRTVLPMTPGYKIRTRLGVSM